MKVVLFIYGTCVGVLGYKLVLIGTPSAPWGLAVIPLVMFGVFCGVES